MQNEKPRVLIIDDEEAIRDGCGQVLIKAGMSVATADNGEAGLELLKRFHPYVVLVDLKMPGMSGMEVLEAIDRFDPHIIKIVITGYASIPLAVEAMKKGAYDFIAKPFAPDELCLQVSRGIERRCLLIESEALRREQEKIRKNMISLVSHELRTPLSAAVQYLEVILSGLGGDISKEARDLIHHSNMRLREMLDLISRWLNLATMDSEKLSETFSEVDLVEIACEAMELLKPLAKKKHVDLSLNAATRASPIKGNKVALKEVFSNLISNAIKYNHPGGWVKVGLYENDHAVGVEISDNGIGIAEEHQSRIFDEFYRVDGRRAGPVTGSGLGLSIAKKIVDVHEGVLEMQSKLGEGTTFRVLFSKP